MCFEKPNNSVGFKASKELHNLDRLKTDDH